MSIAEQISDLSRRLTRTNKRIPHFRWATVETVDPTTVVMDGPGTVPMPVVDVLVPSLVIGQRVEVRIIGDRRDITGRSGG